MPTIATGRRRPRGFWSPPAPTISPRRVRPRAISKIPIARCRGARARSARRPLFLARRLAGSLAWDLVAFFTSFGQADRNGLLPTRDLLSGSPGLQGSTFLLMHGFLDFFRGALAVFPSA